MLAVASQIVFCLILAAIIGAIIGYILGKNSCQDCEEHKEYNVVSEDDSVQEDSSADEQEQDKVEDQGKAPPVLSEPRNGKKDNLQLIKGIGRVIEETLNKKGIFHFDQIANWSEEEIKWIDNAISFPGRAKREKWVEQAKKLASGEETEFSKRVERGEVSTSQKSS